jgi:hypothetical protein
MRPKSIHVMAFAMCLFLNTRGWWRFGHSLLPVRLCHGREKIGNKQFLNPAPIPTSVAAALAVPKH